MRAAHIYQYAYCPTFTGTQEKSTLPCANLLNGKYRYTDDLLKLAAGGGADHPTHGWSVCHTPINMERLRPFLDKYPDQYLASYIHEGLTRGFRRGYHKSRDCLHSRGQNHPSAQANPHIVDGKVCEELAADRLLGPLSPHLAALVHTSPLGLVPKARQTNKWRMICDLSSPINRSVNDGISPDLCSLQYARVDEAVLIVRSLGQDTQLIKLDLKNAYRMVPTHPADYTLLGIKWREKTYIDRALPFGLRSSPKIFNALADFIAWVLTSTGIPYQLHILIDSNKFELRLSQLICTWVDKKSCTRKELESLLGHLSHAATVIPQGCTFLRSLISLLPHTHAPHLASYPGS